MRPKCGCGRTAEYLCYEEGQPHCEACMKDAIECAAYIMVRKPLDWGNLNEASIGGNQEHHTATRQK